MENVFHVSVYKTGFKKGLEKENLETAETVVTLTDCRLSIQRNMTVFNKIFWCLLLEEQPGTNLKDRAGKGEGFIVLTAICESVVNLIDVNWRKHSLCAGLKL